MSGILSVGPPDDDPPPRPLRWLYPFPFFAKTVNARLPLVAAGAGARGATGLRGRRIEPARALSEDTEACDRAAICMAENEISERTRADSEVRFSGFCGCVDLADSLSTLDEP